MGVGKILIMGLPGSGKSFLASLLKKELECPWFNADQIRSMANDWDFSNEARIRQALRMKNLAEFENRLVICDFVCPTEETRSAFDADYIIWMDTIDKSRFADTNNIFEEPSNHDLKIENFEYSIENIVSLINERF